MTYRELSSRAVVTEERKYAEAVVVGYVERIKNAVVCKERVKLRAVRYAQEESDVIFIYAERILSEKIIYNAFIGRNYR